MIAWKKGTHRSLGCFNDVFYLPDEGNVDSEANSQAVLDYVANNHIDVIINQGPFWKGSKRLRHLHCKLVSVLHYAPTFRIENNRNAIDRLYKNSSGKDLLYRAKTAIRHALKGYFAKRDFYRTDCPYFREMVDNSDAFVLLCPSYVEEWKNLLNLRDSRKLFSIHNPIQGREAYDATKAKKTNALLFVGRLTAWDKRVDRLLEIWAELQDEYEDWKLCIVGDGEERDNLIALAEELKLERVEFTGYKDPQPYYRSADILCMTSSSEGYPMVILEAAAYDCPAIAYEVSSGIGDIIDNGRTGFVIAPFRKDDYVEKLRWMMDNKEERLRMGRKAKAKLSEYDVDSIGKQWMALFEKLEERNENINNNPSI